MNEILKSIRNLFASIFRPCKYRKREVMIPMRDGIKLYTAIYEPKDARCCPILVKRTPFSLEPYHSDGRDDLSYGLKNYVKNGYIIVYQNVRGTYLSEGKFENLSREHEAEDSYDTFDWLISNTDNNGNIGVFGVSYPGFYALMTALSGHPALKAVSPQAPVSDWWMGDDTHHNGSFMLSDSYSFGGFFFQDKGNPTEESPQSLVEVDCDIYDYFLSKGGLNETLKPLEHLPFMCKMIEHPNYDEFWRDLVSTNEIGRVKPAMLVVGGTFDAEDCYGAFHTYEALKNGDRENEVKFVCGPWTHGGWRHIDRYLDEIEYPFFAYYLENKGEKPSFKEEIVTSGKETLIMGNGHALTECILPFTPGTYASDPENPIPFIDGIGPYKKSNEEPVLWRDKSYMWADQSFLDGRNDVITCVCETISEDVLVSGPLKVHLEFILDSDDVDFVVKLLDESPDGKKTLVRGDVFPARYRKSLSTPSPVSPGSRDNLDFELCPIAHVFEKGHKITVQVQSSWFPLVAMSPQRFVENPYKAKKGDHRITRVTIMEGSYIRLLKGTCCSLSFNDCGKASFSEHGN